MKKLRRPPGLWPLLQTFTVATLLLLRFDVSAQLPPPAPWITTYPGTDNLKNYSSIPIWISGVPNPPMGGTLMAGTHFGPVGAAGNPNATHFVRVDNQGAVQVWEYLQETGANCMDERAITVSNDPNNYNEIYLTSLVRFDDNGFFSDRIKIYVVDFNGNIVRQNIIQSTDHFWKNLYPTHTLLSPGLDGGTLYICGYVMEANSLSLPGQGPTYLWTGNPQRTNKAAFVMRVNSATLTMTHFKIFDYTYPALPPGTGTFPDPSTLGQAPVGFPPSSDYQPALPPIGLGNDFDIATRLNIIDNARIHVTGSVTAMSFGIHVPPSGATWAPVATSEYVSGVMNLTLDPNDLSTKEDKPFRIEDGTDPIYAMGMDIKFGFTPAMEYYIVANHFTPEIIVGSPTHPDLSGYAPIPHHMFATYCEAVPQSIHPWSGNPTNHVPIPMYNTEPDEYVNAGFTIGGTVPMPSAISYGNPRLQDEEWGINSVTGPSWLTQSQPPHCDMWIGGYRKHPVRYREYEPTLTRLQLGYNPGTGIINIAPPIQMYYSSMTGTGTFPDLGNGLSNMLWAPPMTTAIDNWDIMMAVPKWNGASSLNLKYVHVDRNTGTLVPSSGPNTGTDYCMNSYGTFSNTEYTYKVLPPHGIDMDLSVITTDGTATDITPVSLLTVNIQNDDPCFTTGVYKTAGIGKLNTGNKTIVYPNPAQDAVTVLLEENVGGAAEVRIELVNLQGGVVKVLYKGTATNVPASIQLPDIANGLYMVEVFNGQQMIHHEKLAVLP